MSFMSMYFDEMLHNNLEINEYGLKLNKQQMKSIKKKLSKLDDKAPAMSVTHLNFERLWNQVKGELKISTFGQTFRATCTGACPEEVYSQLEKDIEKQIEKWKKIRFLKKTNTSSISA